MSPLLLALFFAAEPPTASVVHVKEREPLILLISAAKNAPVDLSELLAIAGPVFEQETSFELLSPERAAIDPEIFAECTEHRIACWYRGLLDANRTPSVLLLGIFSKSPGTIEQVAIYFDEKSNPKNIPAMESDETLENRLLAHATEAPKRELRAGDAAALEQYFRDLLTGDLRAALEKNNRLADFGALELNTISPGSVVEIDDSFAATATYPTLRVEGLRAGKRRVVVRAPGVKNPLLSTELVLRSKETVSVAIAAPPEAPRNELLFWGGGALAGTGAALTIYALARNETPGFRACEGAGCMPSDGGKFSTFCTGAECDGLGSLRIAPFGYSLMLTGIIWALGELWTDREYNYLALAAGIAGGLALYGVSVAAE
jgi:hypothetical protein